MYSSTYILTIESPTTTMNYKSLKIILTPLIIFFFSFNLYASEWGKAEKDETKLFNVQVLESTAQVISDSIDFSSTTEAHRRIEIKSEVMTTIEKVLVKAGKSVKKGQHVIKLEEFDSNQDLYELDLLSENEFKKIALFAPFGGILLDGHKIGGELVMPGEKVYEIIDLSQLKIFGYINENGMFFGFLAPYFQTISYSALFLFHMIPGITEVLRRFPPDNPIVIDSNVDHPILIIFYITFFISYLIITTNQIIWLKKRSD